MLASMTMVQTTARALSSVPVGKTPGQFGDWLRHELTERGYDLRRGGQSQFAREADIDVSIINRTLKNERLPEIDGLRRMGRVLGHSLGEMLVGAGLAAPDELPVHPQSSVRTHSTVKAAALSRALQDLRASAQAAGKTLGQVLIEHGLAKEDLVIPAALPPDPVITEIEASDIPEDVKAHLVRMHLDNRAQAFEEARLEREQKKGRPGG